MIYRMALYSATLNGPYPDFKVTPLFDAKYLRNSIRYRHSYNGILIGTYTRPSQACHFEWPWVTLSDLAKYSMTRSVARSLCDSWASCLCTVAYTNTWAVLTDMAVGLGLCLNFVCVLAFLPFVCHRLSFYVFLCAFFVLFVYFGGVVWLFPVKDSSPQWSIIVSSRTSNRAHPVSIVKLML